MNRKIIALFGMLASLLGVCGISQIGIVNAYANTVSITGSLTVPSNCLLSFDITSFNFGSLAQGTNIATTQNVLTGTNGGNANTNMLVSGAAWTYASNTFVVGNTRWARTATAWASATALTGTPFDSSILVPSGGATNTITWAGAVPLYTPVGTYTQAISISSSC